MASIDNQDRAFNGQLDASIPKYLLAEGSVARLINCKFVEGAITNGVGFDELEFEYSEGPFKRVFASPITFQELLERGDLQLFAPLENIAGKFLVFVISGVIFRADLDSCIAAEITPQDACLPSSSSDYPLSYLDNDGGVYGSGGYLVIFNYPNKSIFVTDTGARLANPGDYETPPSRMGATAGRRAFIISGQNLMWASDPLGGAQSLAPLTFQETYPGGTFAGQIFTIGSALDVETVTSICRLPQYQGPAQDFLAQQLLVSTTRKKYVIAASTPRTDWENINFITYLGGGPGIAGPLACTNIGSVLTYISTTGRIKTVGQDQEIETSLTESFLDDPLGQYLCSCEPSFYFRDWYKTLDHSRSSIKYTQDRVYATVYPQLTPGIDKFGQEVDTPSHRALAVGSLDSRTRLGPSASIAWEGFYDWVKPAYLATMDNLLYIAEKDEYGKIRVYRENLTKVDTHKSTIYTRGYFSAQGSKSRSLLSGSFYFRRLEGSVKISISYLINEKWVCGVECMNSSKLFRFSIQKNRCSTDSAGIPLKIDIDHKGCRYELENIIVEGEVHNEESRRKN